VIGVGVGVLKFTFLFRGRNRGRAVILLQIEDFGLMIGWWDSINAFFQNGKERESGDFALV